MSLRLPACDLKPGDLVAYGRNWRQVAEVRHYSEHCAVEFSDLGVSLFRHSEHQEVIVVRS